MLGPVNFQKLTVKVDYVKRNERMPSFFLDAAKPL